jgi:ABC-2 type transport system permease protein
MQGLTPFLLAPIYVLMPMISSGGLHGAIAAIGSQRIDGQAAMIALGVVQFMFLTNPVASTAISRDGRFIWYGRTLPVRPIDEVNGKLLHVLAWSGAFVLIACGLLIWVVHPSALLAITFTIANLSAAITASELGMLTDIRSPRLAWTNPQQAFKGNFNGVVTSLLYLLALTAIALPLAFFLRGNPILACSLAAVIFGAIAVAFHQQLVRVATEQYDQLQAE